MTSISVRSLLLCQLADDADQLDVAVRYQLEIVLKTQEKLRELISKRDIILKAHEVLKGEK